MGLFDIFKKKPEKTVYAINPNGWMPVYPQFGTNIFASDAVQQSLSCIVSELKKLRPVHIRENGSDTTAVRDSTVQTVLNRPNQLMTTSDFLEKTFWLLLLNCNAFIIPTYYTWEDKKTGETRRYYKELYPIKPTEVNFLQDATGRLYAQFYFMDGSSTTYPYDDIIHLKMRYSVNDYMGGNELGQPDNQAILKTLELNHELLHGIAKAMKASYAVNAVVRYNTILDDGKMQQEIAIMEKKLADSESGILPLDLKADFTPLPKSVQIVSEDTLAFIDQKILRNWGVPLDILTGDFTKEQFEAFYQKTLEPIIIAASQEFTAKLFTERERAFGNKVKLMPKDLIFMTMTQTLEMINILSPTGALYENEKRAALGLPPLPELEGKRYMSLNWVEADKASQYQLGKVNIDIVDENKTVEE